MNIDRNLLKQVLHFLQPLIASLLSGGLGGIFIVLQASIFSLVVSRVFIERAKLEEVRTPLILLLAVVFLRSALIFIHHCSARHLSVKVKSRLRRILFEKIVELGPSQLKDSRSGEISTLALQGIDSLEAYFSQYLPQLFLAAAIPIIILITVFPLDLLSAIILLLTAPLIPIFMYLIGKSSELHTKRQWKELTRMGNFFLDTIRGLTTLKVFNNTREGEKISSASEKYRLVTLQVLRLTFLSALVLEMVATISTAVVAVQIGLRLLNGLIEFQQALFILVIAPEFYLPLRTLGARFHSGMTATTVAKQLFQILDQKKPEIQSNEVQIHHEHLRGDSIRFHSVRVIYPDRKTPSLDNVSFVVPAGKITVLIGASGSGKTTVFNLLLRFIELQGGGIYVGKRSLWDFSLEKWRPYVSWVPQSPHLFNASITENIQMGKDGEIERVLQASKHAHLHDFIESLPNGYETIIGEEGFRLSGGQIQRLALARAFYRDAPILLLDEPTVYIDPQNEQRLLDAISRLSSARTTIIIAHHEKILSLADHVIYMHQGKVLAEGDPGNVLKTVSVKKMSREILES